MGDEVYIDNEHFIVVSTDNDTTVLLAKYNMVIYGYATPIGSVDDLQYNLHDYIDDDSGHYNNKIPFSKTDYWDNGSIIDYSTYPTIYDSTKTAPPVYYDATCRVPFAENTYIDYYKSLGLVDESHSSYSGGDFDNIRNYYEAKYANYSSDVGCYGEHYKYGNGLDPGVNGERGSLKDSETSDDYSIAYYVNRYKNKLETLYSNIDITNARLLTYDEYTTLRNNNITTVYDDFNEYFLGTASSRHYVYVVDNDSEYDPHTVSYNYDERGVRPVLEVPTCSISTVYP